MTKKKLFLITLLILLLAAGGVFFFLKEKGQENSYKKITVKKGDLLQAVQSSGLVSPQNRLEIKPPVAGRIEEVLVREGDLLEKGRTLAWISSNERAALLDSVRTQGKAEIKKWESLYRPTPVIAPISGTVIHRNVETGQSFTSTDPIFVMADRLIIKAQVDETDIAQVKKDQKATITMDAYPNNPIQGKVVHIAYDATLTNNVTTYEVDVLPDVVPDFMRSGMTSNVSIQVSRKDNVLLIPMIAILTDQEGPSVLLENGKKSSVMPIRTGMDDGKSVEIMEGLQEGDVVLIKESSKKGKKSTTSNPLFPSGPRGGGGGGRR